MSAMRLAARLKLTLLAAWVVCLMLMADFGTPTLMAQSEQENVVFRIGTFDRSSAEFSQEDPKQKVNFIVGQSSAGKDWYAAQPAQFLLNPAAHDPEKDGAQPRSITFSLGESPAAAYQLHVALLIESSSVPILWVSINGKHGMFYLHPTLDAGMGDWANAWFPIYSHADVLFPFPGSYLHQGVNTINFRVVEDADKGVPDASLNYDALELDRSVHPAAPTPQILPTIFYQDRQGQLEELVDVFIRHSGIRHGGPAKTASGVDLSIAGKHYHQEIRGEQDFGEEKVQFHVAEFPAQVQARFGATATQQAAVRQWPADKLNELRSPMLH